MFPFLYRVNQTASQPSFLPFVGYFIEYGTRYKKNIILLKNQFNFFIPNSTNRFRTDVNATKSTFLWKLFANEKSQYTFRPENHLHYFICVCVCVSELSTNCYTRQKLHDPQNEMQNETQIG